MTTLTQRIKNGSGEDRELDTYIWCHFGNRTVVGIADEKSHYPGALLCRNNKPPHDECVAPVDNWGDKSYPPRYTSDLNAVFALVERELYPVETISLRGKPGKEQWANIERYGRQSAAVGPDRCRALLLALLAAKEQLK